MAELVQRRIASPLTLFGKVKTANKNAVIELKSTYGISKFRDITAAAGSGEVTNDRTEYSVATGATSGSTATLDSAERGRYQPGTECEAGIGVRCDNTFTDDEDSKWGYFDDVNGFGYGEDATGIYVFIRKDSTDTKVYQTNWNGDRLNGIDTSGLTLKLSDGNIFQINYSWYGYGAIYMNVIIADNDNTQRLINIHKFSVIGETSVLDPNLPIRVEADNGTTTSDITVYVGGRQYSVYQKFNPSKRLNSERVLNVGSIGTTFVPLISFRRKSNYLSVAAKVEGYKLISDESLVYQVIIGGTLTGASFGTPTDLSASETAMEADISATAISGGEVAYQELLSVVGTGNTATGADSLQNLLTEIPGDLPVTLAVRTITGTGATVSALIRWTEEW